MASFPTPFNGSISLYPLGEGHVRKVRVIQYNDYSEQRWKRYTPLKRFEIRLDQITLTEAQAINTFFDSVKGGFDATWDITIGVTTYENMVFETDSFELTERERGVYNLALTCRQVAP